MKDSNNRRTRGENAKEIVRTDLYNTIGKVTFKAKLPVPIRYMIDNKEQKLLHQTSLKIQRCQGLNLPTLSQTPENYAEKLLKRRELASEGFPKELWKQSIFVPKEDFQEVMNFRYKPRKTLKNLNGLYNLLIKFFNNEMLEREDIQLTSYQMTMALKFIEKKHKGTIIRKTIQDLREKMDESVCLDFFNTLIYRSSNKRFAEEIKLIFNFTVKQMKIRFQKSCNLYTTFSKINTVFYLHYFKGLMEKMNVELSYFFNPEQQMKDQKNYRYDYLERLFLSEEFKRDFMAYLVSGEFLKLYLKIIPMKISNILSKFDEYFDKEENHKTGLELFEAYFRNNKRCKLPWMKSELTRGVSQILTWFNH